MLSRQVSREREQASLYICMWTHAWAIRDHKVGPHQKSARMNVCTISDNSTMAGHKPEPIALSRNESPSRICNIR